MKHKTVILEIIVYALIVGFLIIPPFFTPALTSGSMLFNWDFPTKQLILSVFAVFLYLIFDKYIGFYEKYPYPFRQIRWAFPVILAIVYFVSRKYATPKAELYPIIPGTHGIINFFLTFFCSAVYEELMYRYYFPRETLRLLLMRFDSRFFNYLGVLIGAAAFAFAHLYLGWNSVIVAFFAHFFFSGVFYSTGSIWNCIFIHFAYNIVVFILS